MSVHLAASMTFDHHLVVSNSLCVANNNLFEKKPHFHYVQIMKRKQEFGSLNFCCSIDAAPKFLLSFGFLILTIVIISKQ